MVPPDAARRGEFRQTRPFPDYWGGETLSTFTQIFYALRLAQSCQRKPTFYNTIIIAPTVVSYEWCEEVKECFGNKVRVADVWPSLPVTAVPDDA
jgi:hypothetical protein